MTESLQARTLRRQCCCYALDQTRLCRDCQEVARHRVRLDVVYAAVDDADTF